MSFRTMSMESFLHTVAEDTPTPGGGTAAAFETALAAALVAMYGGVSAGSKKVKEEDRAFCAEKAAEVRPLIERALDLADEDSRAFDPVMAAFKMPRATEEQKAARRARIVEATLEAARVPMETARLARRVVETCQELRGKGSPYALSDLESAYQLARSALAGALENVAVNLDSLDEAQGRDLREEHRRLREFCLTIPFYLTHS